MTAQQNSWVILGRKQVVRYEQKPAYIFLENGSAVGQTITYGEIDLRSRALAARLQTLCNSGDRALLLYDSCLENMVAFFACLYAGVIAVPGCPPQRSRRNARLENIVMDCDPRVVLSTSGQLVEIERRGKQNWLLQQLCPLATDTVSPLEADGWKEPVISEDTLAFLQYTSGSTSTPKGVAVTHGNLLHNQAMMQHAFQTTERSTIVSWLPIFHDMGLIGQMLHAFYAGTTCVFMSPMSFLQHPLRWLEAISAYKGEISGGPNFSYDLCTKKIPEEALQTLDLSSWRVALNGAEPVQQQALEDFSQRFAQCGFQKRAFYPGYGMAEATLLISGGCPGRDPVYCWVDKEELRKDKAIASSPSAPSSQALVGCGTRILDEAIVIVDAKSAEPCQDGQIGEIWVAGKHVASGYWGRPEASHNAFQAYLSDGRGPFLRTGDLGFFQDGVLFITGRLKEVIILHGSKYYPQDLEASIQETVPAVCPHGVAVVGVNSQAGEKVIAVAEIERAMLRKANLEGVAHSIRRVVSEDHGVVLHDVLLIRPGSLPKTTSGKIQRRLCSDLYLSEGLQTCYQDSSHETVLSATAI